MLRKGSLIAVGIVILANAAMLAEVARNRSGEPEASLRLTERELRLPAPGGEDTGISLVLDWNRRERLFEEGSALMWFDQRKLESIGFDCSVAPSSRDAEEHYRDRLRPGRRAYAVLEYRANAPDLPSSPPSDFPAATQPGRGWTAPTDAERPWLSRLVPVDVGLDPAALRRRYPDRQRFVVLEASARLVFHPAKAGRPASVSGMLNYVTPAEISVPRQHRSLLERLARTSAEPGPYARLNHGPRYEVTVVVGHHLEPWVEKVEPCRGPVVRILNLEPGATRNAHHHIQGGAPRE